MCVYFSVHMMMIVMQCYNSINALVSLLQRGWPIFEKGVIEKSREIFYKEG